MAARPLTIIVEFQIRSDRVDRAQWLEVWRRRAEDVGSWLGEIEDWGRWAPIDRDDSSVDLTLHAIGLTFEDPEAKARFIERSTPVAASIAADDPDVKILGLGEALKADDRNPELKAGDLVLVAVTGRADHTASSAIGQQLELPAVSFERTYRTVDAGFFWQ